MKMVDLRNINSVKNLKADFHALYDTPSGDNVMDFMESICNWYPIAGDSSETNDVIARDARRQVLATIKTFLKCNPDEIKAVGDLY